MIRPGRSGGGAVKKRALPVLAACLLLSGCASLLERSYSVVEPYTDRYWESGEEDVLKAENYQDLVNTLLMLVEQRAEEGVIRYYTADNAYVTAWEARQEVCRETPQGAYLLQEMRFSTQVTADYCTLIYTMTYREDVEDVSTLMTLSDSQSLVDLLRLALREEHPRLTAQFAYETELRENVVAAVEGLWRDICLDELAEEPAETAEEAAPDGEEAPAEGEVPPEEPADEPEPPLQEDGEEPEETDETGQEAETLPELPPCPWEIRFYPDMEYAGIVEILLTGADGAAPHPAAEGTPEEK